MDLDIVQQLSVVAACARNEAQAWLTQACLAALAVLLAVLAFAKFAPLLDQVWRRYLRLDGFGKLVIAAFFCGMWMYGATKESRPQNAGSDEGIGLFGITYDVTNVVESASVTNTFTMVGVFFSSGVTAETPVKVRLSQTNEWVDVVKINPTVYQDSVTNKLSFSASGDLSVYPCWWVGSEPPGIIIEVTGIKLEAFVASAQTVYIEWSCDDERAVSFDVEYRNGTNGEWTKVATTADCAIQVSGFFVNRTTQWRVSSSFEGGAQ